MGSTKINSLIKKRIWKSNYLKALGKFGSFAFEIIFVYSHKNNSLAFFSIDNQAVTRNL